MGKKKRKSTTKDENKNTEASIEPTTDEEAPKKSIWKVLSTVLFVICIILVIYAYDLRYEYKNCDENLGMCFVELENAEAEVGDLNVRLERMEREANAHGLGDITKNPLPDKYIEEFKKKGLLNPVNNLLNDLYHRPEIIPYDAPGNFTFRFSDRRLVYLLSPNRAFANFASRDIKGWLYLSYKVNGKDDIQWKVIESYCPDLDK